MPFNSKEFKAFAKSWNFQTVTSSPTYPKSNGLVERNVQTIKRLFKKAHGEGKDEEMALLEFHNTPITGLDVSPAQLLMSRHLRSGLPITVTTLQPFVNEGVREKLKQRQQQQKYRYDKQAKPLSNLQPKDVVRYQTGRTWKPAIVISNHSSPRSYNIQTSQGTILRRNRYHLKPTKETFSPCDDTDDYLDDEIDNNASTPDPQLSNEAPQSNEPPQTGERRSRYGRVIRPPVRYRDD